MAALVWLQTNGDISTYLKRSWKWDQRLLQHQNRPTTTTLTSPTLWRESGTSSRSTWLERCARWASPAICWVLSFWGVITRCVERPGFCCRCWPWQMSCTWSLVYSTRLWSASNSKRTGCRSSCGVVGRTSRCTRGRRRQWLRRRLSGWSSYSQPTATSPSVNLCTRYSTAPCRVYARPSLASGSSPSSTICRGTSSASSCPLTPRRLSRRMSRRRHHPKPRRREQQQLSTVSASSISGRQCVRAPFTSSSTKLVFSSFFDSLFRSRRSRFSTSGSSVRCASRADSESRWRAA